MQLAAFVLSLVALTASLVASRRQMRLSRHLNSISVLVDLFREHRSDRLARARKFVFAELSTFNLHEGLSGLPESERDLVRDLAWFYDNLGALVLHDIVDIEPIAGYLGGSIIDSWEKMAPIVDAERRIRMAGGSSDPGRWQEYFQYLYNLVCIGTPQSARDKRVRSSFKAPMRTRFHKGFGKWKTSLIKFLQW